MKKKINCVLLIDDDEPTNFLSQMIIEEAHCTNEIQVASSGEKAIDYLVNKSNCVENENNYPCPDLIFLDINMPAMNGWEFLEKYDGLEKDRRGKVVIIMLTTSLNPDDKLRSEEFPHVSGFEHKPLTSEKLDMILKKHFPGNY
jgi:CheY-like chemotaxis protein